MPYSYASFTTAKQQLAQRLSDPSMKFWADTELGLYIIEALRTFNALANYWRSEFTFQSSDGVVWYDITNLVVAPNTNRPVTVTDVDLFTLLEYHLLEPPTGATWTGSSQFGIDDLLNAVSRKRDELLSSTGCTITRRTVGAVAGRTFLPDTVIDIRRIAWLPVDLSGSYENTPLWPSDTFAEQSFNPDYTTQDPGTPSTYLRSTEPPLSFDTDIPPAVVGDYELLTVEAGAALSVVSPSTLNLPDDWAWIIKWGALADLLARESVSIDDLRAQYALSRYKMGLAALSSAPAVLAARLANETLEIEAVQNADNYNVGWQAETAGEPSVLLIAGLNIVGLSITPDAGPYSITLMTLQNAPVPSVGTDSIQVGRDDYDSILDYAQHLAMYKCGGAEFLGSLPLLQRFLKRVSMYNSKLMELGEFTDVLGGMSQLQQEFNPTFNSTTNQDE